MKVKLLLTIFMMLPLVASAELLGPVEIDGIYYNLNTEGNTAEVRENPQHYSGDIKIPETVTYEDVVYSVTSIRWEAFKLCYGLTSVSIANSVTTIGDAAFQYCNALNSITIPASVTTIGVDVFSGCNNLEKVIVPDIAAWCRIRFGENPLLYAHHLYSDESNEIKDLIIPDGVTYIFPCAFIGCSGLTSITFPESLTAIGGSAFRYCSGLTSVTIGNSITLIESYAFANCSGLNSITLGNSVKAIGDYVFNDCSALTSVILPKSVTSIGKSAFDGCRLENVLTKNAKINFSEAFSDRTYQHAMLYVPEGSWGEAVYESSWYLFNNIKEAAMTSGSLSPAVAYTLMDVNTFGYATYDAASDEVRMAKAFYSIDEQDVNNSWQVKTQGEQKYLYNIGAKKYASVASDGHISLSESPTAVTMTETDNGILIGTDNSRQWAFIKNGSLPDATGIDAQTAISGQQPSSYYTVDGQRLAQPKQGLNIIHMSNGTTKKVVVR
jgi:hypothetical protein